MSTIADYLPRYCTLRLLLYYSNRIQQSGHYNCIRMFAAGKGMQKNSSTYVRLAAVILNHYEKVFSQVQLSKSFLQKLQRK